MQPLPSTIQPGSKILDQELLTVAGICGAALLGALSIAIQQDWIRANTRSVLLACIVGAALIGASLFAQWNTALCLFVIVLGAASLVQLGRLSLRRHTSPYT